MKRLIISLLWSVGIAAMWLVVVVAWAYATIGLFPLTGWTADTTATVVQTGFDLGRWLQSFKEVMEFFRDNYPLILTFIGIVGGIYGAIQHRGKNAAVSALDLMTTSVEIAEEPLPRKKRRVKRHVEGAASVLKGTLAGRSLDSSIKRADGSAVPLRERFMALLARRGKG
jgi:TRAP-type C4-dicarboxylate transport system permease large subunit